MAERRSVFSIPLVRELAAVLVIKLALIFVIKALFFSDPVELTDPQDAVAQQLGLSSQTSFQSSSPQSEAQQ
ncbi:cytochrome oxidase putative small subunit CydP [Thalassolituus sp. LLYu03]|uniref:cytochrome oxidase putative small subunit CydP n=1 Tax=Thalassolituus sp. LLYu03 TaxID=3421656 RepID=UPI003D298FDF